MSLKKHSLCADKMPRYVKNSLCVKIISCGCHGNHKYSLKLLKLFAKAIKNGSSWKTFYHIFEGDIYSKPHEAKKTRSIGFILPLK